jgi:hypothetical protein
MAALVGPVAEIGYVATGLGSAAPEVSVVKDDNASATKNTDGGDVVTHATERFAAFTAAQAEKITAEITVPIEAGPAPAPVAAMPVATGGPFTTGLGVPPAATRASGSTRTTIPSNRKNGATAAFDPQALPVHAPALPLDTGGTADLLLHTDFTGPIATAIFSIVVIRFALDGLLRETHGGEQKQAKRKTYKAKDGAYFHAISPVKIRPRTTPLDVGGPGLEARWAGEAYHMGSARGQGHAENKSVILGDAITDL